MAATATELTDEQVFGQAPAQTKELSDADVFGSPSPTPEVDKAVAKTAAFAGAMAAVKSGLDQYPAIRNAGQAAIEFAKGVPQMAAQLPGMAFQGLKFASGGLQEKAQVAGELLKQAVPMGVQEAKDLQAPVGSQPWFRGMITAGTLAAPGVELFRDLRAPIEVKPPIQEGVADASQVGSAAEVPIQPVRGEVGQETPLRQPGEVAQAQETKTPTSQSSQTILTTPEGTQVAIDKPPVQGGDILSEKAQTVVGAEGEKGQETRKEILAEPAAVSVPESAPAAEPLVNDHPVVSAIANKYSQERTASGDLGKITPGESASVQDLATRGQRIVEQQGEGIVDQAVSRVMSGTFDPVEDSAVMRFQEARLRARKDAAYRQLKADPTNIANQQAYENAFKDLTDFHQGPIATVKTNWAQAGRGLQGSFPVDLSTADGLREAWLQNTGKDMPEDVRPVAEKVANRVRETVDLENGSKSKLGNAIEDAYAKRISKLTHDQIRDRFLKELENRPCR